MDKGKLIEEMENRYNNIYKLKKEIAGFKKEKAEQRSRYWGEATGIAKEKEDYIKAMTSGVDEKIRLNEAEIQYNLDMIEILDFKLVYCDE